jgi:hypothetical protein
MSHGWVFRWINRSYPAWRGVALCDLIAFMWFLNVAGCMKSSFYVGYFIWSFFCNIAKGDRGVEGVQCVRGSCQEINSVR